MKGFVLDEGKPQVVITISIIIRNTCKFLSILLIASNPAAYADRNEKNLLEMRKISLGVGFF